MSTENKRDERQSHREANKEREEQEGRVNKGPQDQDAAKEQAPDGAAKGLDTEDASLVFEEEARVQAQRDIERAEANRRYQEEEDFDRRMAMLRLENERDALANQKMELQVKNSELKLMARKLDMEQSRFTAVDGSSSTYGLESPAHQFSGTGGRTLDASGPNTFKKLIGRGAVIKQENDRQSGKNQPDQNVQYDEESSGSEDSAGADSDAVKGSSSTKITSRRSRSNAIVTNGEQSDWERVKFLFKGPIQAYKLTKWVRRVRKHYADPDVIDWDQDEYDEHRKRYASRDEDLYNVLVDSCSEKTSKTKVVESTMAMAARNGDKSGDIPYGHGALFFLYMENLFENVKKNDPNYRAGACENFRAAKMSKKQTPLEWKEELQALQNECGGGILENELVQRYVTKLSAAYDTIIDQYASKDPDETWTLDKAFKKANLYWTLRVRPDSVGKSDENDHDRKKRKKKKRRDHADRDAVSEMFVAALAVTTHCDWCGAAGHQYKDCTVETVTKHCTHCKLNNHWVHQCFKLRKSPKGKGKGKGGKGGKGRGRGRGKGKQPHQEKHYGLQAQTWSGPAPAPAPTPAPAPAPSAPASSQHPGDEDDSYDYDQEGWQMHGMNFKCEDSNSDGPTSTESFFGIPPSLR